MANLSITTAWNETAAFVRREGRLLFPIAFMLLALPIGLLELLMPPPPAPGQLPEAGGWLALAPLALAASMIGNIAISYLSLRPGLSVAEALRRGAGRFLILFATLMLIFVAIAIVFLLVAAFSVVVVPGALESAKGGVPTPSMATASLLMLAILLPLAIYFGARLTVLTPLAANEPGGPLALIGRSWALTAGHVWKLAGFLLLVGIVVGVLSAALESVAGILIALIGGSVAPGGVGALLVILVMTLVNTLVGSYLAVLLARIYAQLADVSSSGT